MQCGTEGVKGSGRYKGALEGRGEVPGSLSSHPISGEAPLELRTLLASIRAGAGFRVYGGCSAWGHSVPVFMRQRTQCVPL